MDLRWAKTPRSNVIFSCSDGINIAEDLHTVTRQYNKPTGLITVTEGDQKLPIHEDREGVSNPCSFRIAINSVIKSPKTLIRSTEVHSVHLLIQTSREGFVAAYLVSFYCVDDS